MAFADPTTITISTVATGFARTASGAGSGEFRNSVGDLVLDVRHAYGKKINRTIGLTRLKYSADPINSAINRPLKTTVRVSVAVDAGASNADIKADLIGLLTLLTASSGAKIDQLLGGEN
uniref:Coat protein n=1 Tax=Leviviridae sp. TaxID=2027243 RepID=A0A514D7N9_9VIRU|nr:MAG: hypothetical protein H1RhizoLitter31390_000002 [Leviviridae sp.]